MVIILDLTVRYMQCQFGPGSSSHEQHISLEKARNMGKLNGTQQRHYNRFIVLACVGGFRRHCTLWQPWKIMLAHNELLKRHKKSYPSHKMSSLPFLSLCYKYSHKYPLDLFYFFPIESCSEWWIQSCPIFSLFGLILELHIGRALVLHPGRPKQNTKHYSHPQRPLVY